MQPELVLDGDAELGEGPAWDATNAQLTWVDIQAGNLHVFQPRDNTDTCFALGEPVGCAAMCRSGEVIVAMRSGLAVYSLSTQALTRLVAPEKHLPGNRFNDGKCDPAGRLLAGTMDNMEKESSGSLYSYSPDGNLKILLTGLRISNGMAWSPDFRSFYFIDTPTRQVNAYDYDLVNGKITNPRLAVSIPSGLGWPDGMTSDSHGMLWVAMWGGAKVTRWDPFTGQLLEMIQLPALNVTACVFGGENLTELYITSARKGMSREQMDEFPLTGSLFRVRSAIQGMPSFAFGRE